MKEKKSGKKEESFEKALQGLEKVVQRLESGDLPLEESLSAFEEGVRLTRVCSQRLDKAEKRIEILMRDEKGSLKTESLDPATFEQGREDAKGEGETG